jgi:hypothetical protein
MDKAALQGMIKNVVSFNYCFLQGSKIAKTNEERYFLYQLIKARSFSVKIETELRYRATDENRWTAADFHAHCDGRGPTIVLIKVKDTNRRCGGFTMATWSSEILTKADPHAFLFSLDPMQHYQVRNPANAIRTDSRYGPMFGTNHNLSVHTGPFNVAGCYSRPECPDYYTPYDGPNSVLT